MSIVSLKTTDGASIEYVDTCIAQGGMKDVYFSPDKSYVVAFFRKPLDHQGMERLKAIVGPYKERMFNQAGGSYWRELFCWPTGIVEKDGKIGVVAPAYKSHFFFTHGPAPTSATDLRGKEKQGRWFARSVLRARDVPQQEKGDLLSYLRICLEISRAVRRLHAAGLAHSDLSYQNVLVDPVTGKACVIDIDGLVVPSKFAPDVVGTPDFIAPEVVATQHLPKHDARRKLPSVETDRHALAVLIYMYLFYRHPLRGRKIHAEDPQQDESMAMGSHALFIEHPNDSSNRVRATDLRKQEEFWGDPQKTPYKIAGPLLADLFQRAFIDGLHDPQKRPTAADWEMGLLRTMDRIVPCDQKCEMGWHVYSASTSPTCPYCGAPHKGELPILNLYSKRQAKSYRSDDCRLTVWNGRRIFPWHVHRHVSPNEQLSSEQMKSVGYFQQNNGAWYLVNESMPDMLNRSDNRRVAPGEHVKLVDGLQIQLSPDDGGRAFLTQMVNKR